MRMSNYAKLDRGKLRAKQLGEVIKTLTRQKDDLEIQTNEAKLPPA